MTVLLHRGCCLALLLIVPHPNLDLPHAFLISSSCCVAAEASPVTAGDSRDSDAPTVLTSGIHQPSLHKEVPQSAVTAQASTATLPSPAPSHAANTAAEGRPAQTPALPVADMQALAKRIGMANAAPAQPSKHEHSPVPDLGLGIRPPQAVNAPGAVPYEIQAIIQKLVHFIKVGPSGHVRPHTQKRCAVYGSASRIC